MRLLRPGPGECADRQTILELKMKYGGRQEPVTSSDESTVQNSGGTITRRTFRPAGSMDIQPFVDEHELIQRHLESNWFPSLVKNIQGQSDYDRMYEELAEVNQQIWKLMDQAKILRDAPDRETGLARERAAEVLFTIFDLNEKRAQLVQRVNVLFGVNVQEKIYA